MASRVLGCSSFLQSQQVSLFQKMIFATPNPIQKSFFEYEFWACKWCKLVLFYNLEIHFLTRARTQTFFGKFRFAQAFLQSRREKYARRGGSGVKISYLIVLILQAQMFAPRTCKIKWRKKITNENSVFRLSKRHVP